MIIGSRSDFLPHLDLPVIDRMTGKVDMFEFQGIKRRLLQRGNWICTDPVFTAVCYCFRSGNLPLLTTWLYFTRQLDQHWRYHILISSYPGTWSQNASCDYAFGRSCGHRGTRGTVRKSTVVRCCSEATFLRCYMNVAARQRNNILSDVPKLFMYCLKPVQKDLLDNVSVLHVLCQQGLFRFVVPFSSGSV